MTVTMIWLISLCSLLLLNRLKLVRSQMLSITSVGLDSAKALTVQISYSNTTDGLKSGEKVLYIAFICSDHDNRVYYHDRNTPGEYQNAFGPIRNGKEYVIEVQIVSSEGNIVASASQTYYLASLGIRRFRLSQDATGSQINAMIRTFSHSLYGDYKIECYDLVKNITGEVAYTVTLESLLDDNFRNLALGKPSGSSRPTKNHPPDLGNNGEFTDFIRSMGQPPYWWMVNLEALYRIERVDLYIQDPRCDEETSEQYLCGEKVNHISILTANTPQDPGVPGLVSGVWSNQAYSPKEYEKLLIILLNGRVLAQHVAVFSNSSTRDLTFVEVEIYEHARRNLAFEKPVRQSTIGSFKHRPETAVDGIDKAQYGYSATNAEANSWWLVDLQQRVKIESMQIYPVISAQRLESYGTVQKYEFFIQGSFNRIPCSDIFTGTFYANNFVYPVTRVLFVPAVKTRLLAICSLLNDSLQLHEVTVFQESSGDIERQIARDKNILHNGGVFECMLSPLEATNSKADSISTVLKIKPVTPTLDRNLIIISADDYHYIRVAVDKVNPTDYYTDLLMNVKDDKGGNTNAEVTFTYNGIEIRKLIFGLPYLMDIIASTVYEDQVLYGDSLVDIKISVPPLPPQGINVSFSFEELAATVTVTNYPLDVNHIHNVHLSISSNSKTVMLGRSETFYKWENLVIGRNYTFKAWTSSDLVEELSEKIAVTKSFGQESEDSGTQLLYQVAIALCSSTILMLMAIICCLCQRQRRNIRKQRKLKKITQSNLAPLSSSYLHAEKSHMYPPSHFGKRSDHTIMSGNKSFLTFEVEGGEPSTYYRHLTNFRGDKIYSVKPRTKHLRQIDTPQTLY